MFHGTVFTKRVPLIKRSMNKLYFLVFIIFLSVSVSAKKVATFPDLKNPNQLYLDDSRIYMVDDTFIYIYSSKDYSFIKRFGKRGEGPEEFKLSANETPFLSICDDHLQAISTGRVSFFTKDGKFIKVLTTIEGDIFQKIGNSYVGWKRIKDNNIQYELINLYDSSFKKIKEISRRESGIQPGKRKINPLTWFVNNFQVYKDKIFIDKKEFTIFVFNEKGEKLYDINLESEKMRINDEMRKRILHYYEVESPYWKIRWPRLKSWFVFSEFFPIVRNFQVVDDKIYINTFLEKNDKSGFIILDLQGKVLKKTLLPLKKESFFVIYPFFIKNNKLYQVLFNDKVEEWELHVEEIR
jgi:hypothetical protein